MAPSSKDKLLSASTELFRWKGYIGTSLTDIVEQGGAPIGSLYHFFRGGKEELGVSTVRLAGEQYARLIEGVLGAAPDAATAVRDMFALGAEALESSDFRDGCPIATVALETANANEPLRQACAEVFGLWTAVLAQRLCDAGKKPKQAARLATFGIAAFEGALILSRTMRDTGPLEVTAELVARTLR
jgi:TetR/AcrR family transcriptional repressor of lmrAB and yxaGH operons